jgi:hypothetical protein
MGRQPLPRQHSGGNSNSRKLASSLKCRKTSASRISPRSRTSSCGSLHPRVAFGPATRSSTRSVLMVSVSFIPTAYQNLWNASIFTRTVSFRLYNQKLRKASSWPHGQKITRGSCSAPKRPSSMCHLPGSHSSRAPVSHPACLDGQTTETHRREEVIRRHAWISPSTSGTVNQKVAP